MSDTKKNDDTTDEPATSTTQPTDTPKRRKSMLGFGAIMKATSKFKVKWINSLNEISKLENYTNSNIRDSRVLHIFYKEVDHDSYTLPN